MCSSSSIDKKIDMILLDLKAVRKYRKIDERMLVS